MSRSDELPPDLRATLSLLLRQGKSYAEVAKLLGIAPAAVHDRAHAALAMLAPGAARKVSPAMREEVGEYVLGQQPAVAERMRTRGLLSSSAPARTWAAALVIELAPVGGELPEIPAAESPAAPAPKGKQQAPSAASPAPPGGGPVPVAAAGAAEGPPWEPAARSLPSSRLGGGLLLAILLAAIVVVVILVVDSGTGKKHPSASASNAGATATSTDTKEEGRFTLKSPEAESKSTGVAEILSEGGKKALFVQAEHIPATKGFFYAIWLYNSTNSASPVSRSPEVGKTHAFSGAVALPSNAGEFKEILVTRETSTKPTHPGHVVLRGPFSVGASGG